ncbi:hypothetical protein MC7420_6003 [Coleofasciculus chthonoplastes PCC 7420]|uniref:Uncharacterized protein n=1 Tax=Coleofasciculus chthonoplastes PCC 7420 TaxID=118168 RepID=B4VTN4_9CYAN|nr:hypothetical protein MC7420_6003 [Coleofasciculus chthonoplastes PCC 7420]
MSGILADLPHFLMIAPAGFGINNLKRLNSSPSARLTKLGVK